jgi:MFS transporter, PHS family, inorganic phosphate transporter
MLVWLIGTAGAWLLLDFCYYGNSISQPEILKLLNPHASLLHNTLVQLAIVAVFAVPGYIVAVAFMDRTGRKSIQMFGFFMMAVMFLIIGLVPSVVKHAWPFLILYGISYFFTEFGPNMTTFIYPAELFPTDVRTTAHGISAGAASWARSRAPSCSLISWAVTHGINRAMTIAGIVAVLGLLLTLAALPETKGKSLEQLEEDAYAEAPAKPRLGVEPA